MNGHLQQLIEQKRFPELVYIFRKMWDEQGWLYLKRNRNAVDRIKLAFTKLTGNQPYANASQAKAWDRNIAGYVDRLGVAALLDDMRQAAQKQGNIKSLVYFLWAKAGACRWENMLMQKIQADIKAQKAEYEQIDAAIAEMLNSAQEEQEPEWVIQAREEYGRLLRLAGSLDVSRDIKVDCVKHMQRIKHNFKTHGFQLNQEN